MAATFDDLSAPTDFGAAPAPRSTPPRSQALDDDDSTGGGPSPEHVHFHEDEQRCDMCVHFEGNRCNYLKMPVPPEGGCIAFENSTDGGDDNDADMDDDGGGYGTDTSRTGDLDGDYGI